MPTFNESKRISDFLKWEINPSFTRETVTLVTPNNLVAGYVLGKVTASGKYAPYDNTKVDGTEVAAAVLLYDADASAADVDCVVLKRGPAIIASGNLTWAAANDAAAKTAGIADLATLNIVDRPLV